MVDVFVSYRNLPDRRAYVERLAALLEAHGLDVWWDYGLEAGESYRTQIINKLKLAKVVTPLWCDESVTSQWVLLEAEHGRAKLAPARLQKVTPPGPFEPVQAADLTDWTGSPDHEGLKRFILRLAERANVTLPQRISLIGQMRLLPSLPALGAKSGDVGALSAAARTYAGLDANARAADLTAFIESFPGTEEAFEARRRLADMNAQEQRVGAAFDAAKRAGTRAALLAFAKDYARDSRVAQARDLAQALPRRVTCVERIKTFPGDCDAAAYAPDGRSVVSCSNAERVAYVRDVETGDVLSRAEGFFTSAVAFSPKGDLIAIGGTGASIWRWRTGEIVSTLTHKGTLYRFAFSQQGDRLVASDAMGKMHVWDVSTGQQMLQRNASWQDVLSVRYSSCGRYILSAANAGHVALWRASDLEPVQECGQHAAGANCAAITRDNTIVASGGIDGRVLLWNAIDAREIRAFAGHSDRIWDIAFSPDGAHFATASYDGTSKLWLTKTGELMATLAANSDANRSVQFSPSGDRLLIASRSSASIWRLTLEA